MAYVALKPCRFAGQAFKIGEEIPDGLIHPGSANNLVKMQVIAEAETGTNSTTPDHTPAPASTIPLFIPVQEGNLALEVTHEGLQSVVTVLSGKTAEAEPVIGAMTDGDALILLHLVDNRKAVKAAAEARAKALNEGEVGEQ